MRLMMNKFILDDILKKIILQFPLTCSFGPELDLGEPEYLSDSNNYHNKLLVCHVEVF